MSENLRRLRDAVVGRGRDVEITPDGTVHEVAPENRETEERGTVKPTKLSDRTWGRSPGVVDL